MLSGNSNRACLDEFMSHLRMPGPLLMRLSIANYDDPLAEERDAPPKPLPLQFPEFTPKLKATPLTPQKHADLRRLLMGIRNPGDLGPALVETFNIKFRSNLTISDLIPNLPDGIIEEATLNSILKDEFSLDNDPCFRKVCRLTPEKGQTLPRLAQAYLFFKHLEDMSRYWDNSQDRYFTKNSDSSSLSNEKQRRPSRQKENIKLSKDLNGDTEMTNSAELSANKSSSISQNLYIGRRSGNAATMPPHFRDGALEGLLRAATQKFNAVCKPPPQQYTRLQIGGMLLPVRQTFVIGRVPSDRTEARKAKTLGPMMIGSARSDIVFRNEGDKIGEGQGEVADFLRELGGLLLLAQQRNREGRKEVPPGSGEHCWWATKVRWGGGKGGNMPHEEAELGKEGSVEDFPQLNGDIPMADESTPDSLAPTITRAKRSLDVSFPAINGEDEEKASSQRKLPGSAPLAPIALAPASLNTRPPRLPPSAMFPSGPLSPSDLLAPTGATATTAASTTTTSRPIRPPMSSRRVKMLAEAWKIVKPPCSLWDPNITYAAIGRPEARGEWDHVFMLSSVNSHVCVVKMRASRGYLGWLEGGGTMKAEEKEAKLGKSGISLPVGEERDWEGEVMRREVLYVERSVWWDLFVPEQRAEALKALWTVLSWLSREVGGGIVPWAVE